VAAAQERVAREGYYRGQIDGVFGSETRAAIAEYQSKHGLRVTGALTNETLAALGLRRVASY
jgi:Putative peptidoglycan binding domain.